MPANLSENILRSAFGLKDTADDARLAADVERLAAPVRQAEAFAMSVPDLGSLLGDVGQAAGGVGQQMQQSAAGAMQMMPTWADAVPSLDGLLGSLKPQPAPTRAVTTPPADGVADVRQPSANGIPSPMPSGGQAPAQPATVRPTASATGYAPSGGRGSEGVERWSDLVSEAARAYNLPEATIKGLMEIESSGNPEAVSSAGAQGLMQVMPFHFAAGENPRDPRTNIMKGAKVYADALARWGDPDKAAAAYFGAIDGNGNITSDTDGSPVDGHAYVRLWREASSKYGAPTPNAGAAPSSASATPPPAPPATGSAPPPAPAGGSGGGDTVTIRSNTGGTLQVPRSSVGEGPGQYSSRPERGGYQIVGAEQDMQRVALSGPEPMPEDASLEHEMIQQTGRVMDRKPPPLRNRVTFDPATGETGAPLDDEGLSYRAPLIPIDPEASTGAAYDPRDADQGAREWTPTSGISSPLPDRTSTLSGSDPSAGAGMTTVAASENPSTTPMRSGSPPILTPTEYIDPDAGPREALPGSVGAGPVGELYGPEPAPAPVSPYDADQSFRPTPRLGTPANEIVSPPIATSPSQDAIDPNDTRAVDEGPRESPRYQPPTTWYGQAAETALQAIAPAVDAMDAANEWLIANPIAGALNPQAWGRELGGTEQIYLETREDQQRLEALIRRFRAGDTSVEPEIQALTASLNRRTQADRASMLAAGERNPDKAAETLGQVVQGVGAAVIAPGLAAGPVRNVVGAALDPIGQGIGAGLETGGRALGAARGAGSRVRGALAQNADNVAAADARMAQEGSTAAPGTLGAAPGEPRRMYHGTAFQFERPSTFDQESLFGPGYYITSNPDVASSYAENAAAPMSGRVSPQTRIRRLGDEVLMLEREAQAASPVDRPAFERVIGQKRQQIDMLERSGPNVRAIDVPEDARLLDADQPSPDDLAFMAQRIAGHINAGDAEIPEIEKWLRGNAVNGELYPTLQQFIGNPKQTNEFLQSIGFDGISYAGGKRIPMTGADGKPVEHQATVIFPEALDRIRNAFSGEIGGATLGQSPGIPGAGLGTRLAADAGSSLGSGTMGAAVGAGLPAETDEERRQNALTGAAVGMVGGPLASRAMRRSPGATATFGASPGYRPPTPQQVARQQAAGARRGAVLNQSVSAPPSEVPRAVRASVRATDDRAGLRWAEDMLSDAAGQPRMRENDPRRPSTQSRVNTGSIADERIQGDLDPAIVGAGRANLQDELPQFLEDMQQRDILDEFYNRAHREVTEARQQAIATAQANNAAPAVIQRMQAKAQADAHTAGVRAMRRRQGASPDMTYEAIEARLQGQEARLTTDGRWQQLQDSAQAIWDHNAQTRQRLVDAGEVDPADAAYWERAYPHYVPTVPISHLDARSGGPVANASGPRVSRGTQKVTHALEDVGTSGERLNPIVASRNATVRAERQIQRNNVARAFAQMMDDALQASPATMGTDPATHRTFLGGGADVTFMDNGKPTTISVPKVVADGLEAAANMSADPGTIGRIWKQVMGVVTSAMTAGRASFLPVNLLRDVQDYAARTATLEGGPHRIPGALGTWFDEAGKAAADIMRAQMTARGATGAASGFAAGAATGDEDQTIGERVARGAAGAMAGTFLVGANKVRTTGAAREFRARGGGSGGLSAHWGAGQRWYREVMRDGGVPIKTPADAARYLGDWLQDAATLQGIKGINERTELISRTAAMRRAEGVRKLDPTEAMVAGRDASYDPDRAGTVARMVNGIVPFFNATVQNAAQTQRLFRQNPVAAAATIAATVGPVMLATEAWNRSDPERARVYDDIPQYIKDSGFVAVMPWAGSDARGERPNYLWIPTGMQTPFVIGMRAAMQHLPGLEPTAGRTGSRADASEIERWGDTLASIVMAFSPLRGDSASAIASNVVPQGAKQALEIGINRDFYRGSPIATDQADERASAASRAVAEGANAAGRALGSDMLQEVRPSQVEHGLRSLPAYADIVTGASDMVAPSGFKQAEDRPVQNAPFLGGIAGRFNRDTGGANLERAQDDRLPDVIRPVLEAAGMRPSDIMPVPSRYKNAPLTRDEQERWQVATNAYVAEQILAAQDRSAWDDRTQRETLVRQAISRARDLAARDVLDATPADLRDRIGREEAMKAR